MEEPETEDEDEEEAADEFRAQVAAHYCSAADIL